MIITSPTAHGSGHVANRIERRQAKRRHRREKKIRQLQLPCTCRACRRSRPPRRWPANYVGSTGWGYECFLEFWQQHVEDEARRELAIAAGRRRWRWLQLATLREILAPILADMATPEPPDTVADAFAADAGLSLCPPGRRSADGRRATTYCERCARRKKPRAPKGARVRPRYCEACQEHAAAELAAAQWTPEEIASWIAGEDLAEQVAAAAEARRRAAIAAAAHADAAHPSSN